MSRHPQHDNATSNVLAWSHHAANVESAAEEEASADSDEPPDLNLTRPKITPEFRRTSVLNKPKDTHASLLTRALQSASESEMPEDPPSQRSNNSRRRRSITSDISAASTADLTSDTGLSTPARTNSPSPRLLDTGFVPLAVEKHHGAPVQIVGSIPRRDVAPYSVRKKDAQPMPTTSTNARDPAVQNIEKKRCISFACTAKPKEDAVKAPVAAPAPVEAVPVPSQPVQTRKPCIKFACPTKPARPAVQQTPPNRERLVIPNTDESGSVSTVVSTPATIRKARSPVARRRPTTPRRIPLSPAPVQRKKKYITASSDELQGEEFHFHEFASDHPTQEAWIRQEATIRKGKLLIDDLLKKENEIRRLAKEAEEEEEEEENDGDDNADEEDEINAEYEDENDDGLEEDIDDGQSGYGSDDDFSDGYNTDEDLGFADSDDDEDDDLLLWTLTASQSYMAKFAGSTPVLRSASPGAISDSSVCSRKATRTKRTRQQSIVARPVTPELPDSTDFVCGTMDEDRPLEEAYATRMAARKLEKLRAIPQDIDPSFPTSDPEDDDEEETHHSHDSGEPLWLHGELEELHDERAGRRQRKHDVSPKRHRSPPPPKRYHSPPPKARGRSPRRLFDHSSPKRIKSPAPVAYLKSPVGSPTHLNNGPNFQALAARPGLTHTKSLPRAAYFPAHLKNGKRAKAHTKNTTHVRGAIDIVKGLEQKRQRRKEKFHQKYCDRARKGQVPEKKKPRVGEGAERMRELGLISAGKRNYVISI
ncbi:hypothetical protein N0V93_005459 [Gnomoniopsis smithogilvyi]|uniref:Uncharacterized protein n=1 Tax=Gnomoniopsis smithogilvyi TaxID=1191159 RepID=A0A9W8YTC5_9PEZI|nr:hypothetical protein N0V93_005459 [Gnomoniopsis smithogilvyi]